MNVWLLARSYYPNVGGIETSIYSISKTMERNGNKLTIITQKIEDPKKYLRKEYAQIMHYEEKETIFSHYCIPLRTWERYRAVKKAMKKVAYCEGEADLVIARDPLMAIVYTKLFDKNKVLYIPPTVIAFDNDNKRKNTFIQTVKSRVLMRMEQYYQEQCFKKLNHIIVFSNNVKNQIEKRLKVKQDNVHVVHPGCDEKFCDSACNYKYNDKLKILFIGRIIEDKNLLMAIKAMQKLEGENIIFDIFGEGMQLQELKDYVHEQKISNINFKGKTSVPEQIYSQYDFFLLPSLYESFGQVISESLSCGTPVIGFKTIPNNTLTAVEELIIHQKTGYVMNRFCTEEICQALYWAQNVKKEKKGYLSMREECFQYALREFSWEIFVNEVVKISDE